LSVQPQMLYEYEGRFPRDLAKTKRPRCFELLGVDVLIDEKMKPWLLEVNQLPSFNTESPIDLDIKRRLITQVLSIIPVLPRSGRKLYEDLCQDDTEENRRAFDALWKNEPKLVDFERVYPTENKEVQERYDEVLRCSTEIHQSAYRRMFLRPVTQTEIERAGSPSAASANTASTSASTNASSHDLGTSKTVKVKGNLARKTTKSGSPRKPGSPRKGGRCKSPRKKSPSRDKRCSLTSKMLREAAMKNLKKMVPKQDDGRALLPMRRVALAFGIAPTFPKGLSPNGLERPVSALS